MGVRAGTYKDVLRPTRLDDWTYGELPGRKTLTDRDPPRTMQGTAGCHTSPGLIYRHRSRESVQMVKKSQRSLQHLKTCKDKVKPRGRRA